MQEVQWPKELVKDVVPMHDKEQNKVLLCSPSHPTEPSRFILRTQ